MNSSNSFIQLTAVYKEHLGVQTYVCAHVFTRHHEIHVTNNGINVNIKDVTQSCHKY